MVVEHIETNVFRVRFTDEEMNRLSLQAQIDNKPYPQVVEWLIEAGVKLYQLTQEVKET